MNRAGPGPGPPGPRQRIGGAAKNRDFPGPYNMNWGNPDRFPPDPLRVPGTGTAAPLNPRKVMVPTL